MPRFAIGPQNVVKRIERLWKRRRRRQPLALNGKPTVPENGSRSERCTGNSSHAVSGADDGRKQEELMRQSEMKVVGYFAYQSRWKVICTDGDACVISGSAAAMKHYLEEVEPDRAIKATVRKTRFGEIVRGLKLGAAYAFDRQSYGRFYPLAVNAGLPVEPADFEDGNRRGGRFFTVRLRRG